MEASPLSLALKNAIHRAGMTATDVAALMNVTRTTVSNRLTKTKPLDPLNAKDQRFVADVAKHLGIKAESIFEEAEKIPFRGVSIPGEQGADPDMLELLLNTIGDPNADPKMKETAKNGVRRMVGVS